MEELMKEYISGALLCDGAFYIVKCAMFSESGYEIAECIDGNLISQANGDRINKYATHYYELND